MYGKGKGLGLTLQGDCSPIVVPEKKNRFGLGYKEKLAGMNLNKKQKKKKAKCTRSLT